MREQGIIEHRAEPQLLTGATRPWFAVQTRAHAEKIVHAELGRKGIESFLPTRTVMRRWSDRKKLIVEPVFTGYVFLRAPEEMRLRALRTPGVVRYVGTPAEPWEVPAKEMSALQTFVDAQLRIDPFPFLKVGQRVYVRSGVLRGIEGFIVRKPRFCRLVISVEMMMQSVAVEVDETSVEPL